MRIVVIGATGHIGTYLVPRLVAAGQEVVAVSRGERQPYRADPAWLSVERVTLDRRAEEAAGSFGSRVARLRGDVIVDLICFTPAQCLQLVDALDGAVGHFLHCGTIWVHGPTEVAPTDETRPRRPFGEYGIAKAAIEALLLARARQSGFPATVLHPGHIVGEGWRPINPQGNLNLRVFEALAAGEALSLPDHGLATLHHVHADDVAQAFERAIGARDVALGEAFHVVSPAAVTLYGFAREAARWFGREPELRLLPWEEWSRGVSEEDARLTFDHLAHSPCASIEKARRLLGYEPRYSSFAAVKEAVAWLIAHGELKAPHLSA